MRCGRNGCLGLSAQDLPAPGGGVEVEPIAYAAKGLIGPAGNGRCSDAMPLLPYAPHWLLLPVDHSGRRPVLPGRCGTGRPAREAEDMPVAAPRASVIDDAGRIVDSEDDRRSGGGDRGGRRWAVGPPWPSASRRPPTVAGGDREPRAERRAARRESAGAFAELGDAIEVQVRPAPGDKGAELAARLRDPSRVGERGPTAKLQGDEPLQKLRTALRQTKAILEVGEVPQTDAPGTTHPGPGGRLVTAADRVAQGRAGLRRCAGGREQGQGRGRPGAADTNSEDVILKVRASAVCGSDLHLLGG